MFNEFHMQNYNIMFRFCKSKGQNEKDAEVITSEAMHRLWLIGINDKKWMYKTIQYIIKEYHRKSNANLVENIDDHTYVLSDDGNIDQIIEIERYIIYIRNIQAQLDENEKELFKLAFIEKISYPEIIENLNITSSTLRSRISRLRKKLRPIMDELLKR